MKAGRPTLMAQAPNRKGNISNMPPKDGVGVTSITGSNKLGVSQPKGNQGTPAHNGVVHGVCKCPVQVSQPPKKYAPTNLGFIAKNNLKFGG
jgi:hypothetical protein